MNTSKKSEADNGSIKNISESTKEDRNKEATSKDISNEMGKEKKSVSWPSDSKVVRKHTGRISSVRKRPMSSSLPDYIISEPLLNHPDNITPRRREQKKKKTPSLISLAYCHKSTQTTSQGFLKVKLLEQKTEERKAAACSIISEDNCPDGWVGYRRNCYYFAETERNWTSSKMNCLSFNASLALVDFKDDMEFLRRYKTPADYWIGLQRNQETEPWKWANGTIFNNWFEVRGGAECAYLNHKGAASSFCSREIPWICTKPKERMSELSRT